MVVPFPTVVYRKCSLFSLQVENDVTRTVFTDEIPPNEPSNSNRGAISLEKWRIIALSIRWKIHLIAKYFNNVH